MRPAFNVEKQSQLLARLFILHMVAASIIGLLIVIASEPWSNWNWLMIASAILLSAAAALKLFEYEKWLSLSIEKILRYTERWNE